MSLLELKDVTMAYGGKVKALDNVNLKVEKGDWLAVMGPSGSGKTTLMNIIGCMDHATSGTVLLDGIDITKVSDHELTLLRRDKIGIVFQQFHMIPYLTAIENIMAAQYYHSIPDRKHSKRSTAWGLPTAPTICRASFRAASSSASALRVPSSTTPCSSSRTSRRATSTRSIRTSS